MMETTVVVRPVEEADADSLGRVHATCWHETYDHLLSAAALSQLHPERFAAMWRRYSSQGPEYRQVVAVIDGEIVGFAGSGPGHDLAVLRTLRRVPAPHGGEAFRVQLRQGRGAQQVIVGFVPAGRVYAAQAVCIRFFNGSNDDCGLHHSTLAESYGVG